jgi:hypothetical protein
MNCHQKWDSDLKVGMTSWLIMDRLECLLKEMRVAQEGKLIINSLHLTDIVADEVYQYKSS